MVNQREGERGNREKHRSQSWVEDTNMTECTQEIGYLQSINSLCVELEKMPLITSGVNFQRMTIAALSSVLV